MACSRTLSAAMLLIGLCALVTGTILVYNSLHPYCEQVGSLVFGSSEIVIGGLLIGFRHSPVVRAMWVLIARRLGVLLLPKPRFTVRGMMVAVAFVALILGGVIGLYRRRERFAGIAASHARQEFLARQLADDGSYIHSACIRSCMCDGSDGWGAEARQAEFRAIATYHAQLKWKYQEAVVQPWVGVSADPPEPGTLPSEDLQIALDSGQEMSTRRAAALRLEHDDREILRRHLNHELPGNGDSKTRDAFELLGIVGNANTGVGLQQLRDHHFRMTAKIRVTIDCAIADIRFRQQQLLASPTHHKLH